MKRKGSESCKINTNTITHKQSGRVTKMLLPQIPEEAAALKTKHSAA